MALIQIPQYTGIIQVETVNAEEYNDRLLSRTSLSDQGKKDLFPIVYHRETDNMSMILNIISLNLANLQMCLI